jgi:hypothetical protein
MNTSDNLELTRASLAPEPAPSHRARFRSVSERICISVARVFRPEAFAVTSSSIETEPTGLTDALKMPHENRPAMSVAKGRGGTTRNSISRHTPREIIALTLRKQTIEVTISRHKKETPIFVDLSSVLSGKTDLRDKRVHAGR